MQNRSRAGPYPRGVRPKLFPRLYRGPRRLPTSVTLPSSRGAHVREAPPPPGSPAAVAGLRRRRCRARAGGCRAGSRGRAGAPPPPNPGQTQTRFSLRQRQRLPSPRLAPRRRQPPALPPPPSPSEPFGAGLGGGGRKPANKLPSPPKTTRPPRGKFVRAPAEPWLGGGQRGAPCAPAQGRGAPARLCPAQAGTEAGKNGLKSLFLVKRRKKKKKGLATKRLQVRVSFISSFLREEGAGDRRNEFQKGFAFRKLQI